MAEKDSYIGEAYEVLQKLSADEKKRLQYERRQKALMDYRSNMKGSYQRGVREGEEQERINAICNMIKIGINDNEILNYYKKEELDKAKQRGQQK